VTVITYYETSGKLCNIQYDNLEYFCEAHRKKYYYFYQTTPSPGRDSSSIQKKTLKHIKNTDNKRKVLRLERKCKVFKEP